jgi:hypothetical protein
LGDATIRGESCELLWLLQRLPSLLRG